MIRSGQNTQGPCAAQILSGLNRRVCYKTLISL